MKTLMIGLATSLLMAAAPSFAQQVDDKLNAELEAFKTLAQTNLSAVDKTYRVDSVTPSGMEGIYRVKVNGQALYISADGKNFFSGALFKIENNQITNLSSLSETAERSALMGQLKPQEMITFSPTLPVKTKKHITVFTDIDCGYCRKLHQEVPELNAMGIEVRYMGFPRAGVGSSSYDKLVSAWCSDDQQGSLTKLKNNEAVPTISCENPIDSQYSLGMKMGVNGTPAILLSDGTMIPGYRSAKDLAKQLGL